MSTFQAIESANNFHTKRELSEADKNACGVLVEALVAGSDEAEEALEVQVKEVDEYSQAPPAAKPRLDTYAQRP